MSLISLIVAHTPDRVIGRDGGMPWHLPADLRHFKTITMGKPILMGRRTFESIGKPLPGRHNIVVTSRGSRSVIGDGPATKLDFAGSLDEALALAADAGEVMVIGGAMLYEAALPMATRIYLTEIGAAVEGDTFFPELDASEWREVSREERPADERNAYPLTFVVLERVRAAPVGAPPMRRER